VKKWICSKKKCFEELLMQGEGRWREREGSVKRREGERRGESKE
jgi:hypothetical protein